MNRLVATLWTGLASLALLLVHSPLRGEEPAPDKRPVVLEVHLPADAQLEVDGLKTQATGEVRHFESPPLATGRKYTYQLKVAWQGKEISREVNVQPEQVAVVDFSDDLKGAAPGTVKTPTPPSSGLPHDGEPFSKPGFVTLLEDGRLWVFRENSKDLAAYHKDGELAKHVIRPGAGPKGMTLLGPDSETILAYVTARDGFETIIEDGRLWVFRAGSKELDEYKKNGELAKHVTLINAGPMGMTIKAADQGTIDAYMKAFSM